MKTFVPFTFSSSECRHELDQLRDLLDSVDRLKERETILPFFRERQHLCVFIGSYFPYLANPDRIAFEYDLFGDFKADLAIGDSTSQQFCFVEFEAATDSSLFVKKGNKATLEWSERFEHGFSQVLDWFGFGNWPIWKIRLSLSVDLAELPATKGFLSLVEVQV